MHYKEYDVLRLLLSSIQVPANERSVHMQTEEAGIFVGPDEGDALINPIGGQMVAKVRDMYTAGAYSVHDNIIPAGSPGPRPHRHRHHEEAFYVLEGRAHRARRSPNDRGSRGLLRNSTKGCGPPTLEPRNGTDQGTAPLLSGGDGPLLRRGSPGAHSATGITAYRSGGPEEAHGFHREVRLRVRRRIIATVRAGHGNWQDRSEAGIPNARLCKKWP